jgi:hypothetical protein
MAVDRAGKKKSFRKDLGNFAGMLHTGLGSHFRAGASCYSKTTFNPLNAFLPGHLAAWIPHVIRYWFHKKYAFRDYAGPGKGTGIYRIGDAATISLAGDWGTGTDEAQKVGECILSGVWRSITAFYKRGSQEKSFPGDWKAQVRWSCRPA